MIKESKPNEIQIEVAHALGINISGVSSFIAALRIRSAVAQAIHLDTRNATEKQVQFARELGLDVSGNSMTAASVKIQCELEERNYHTLKKLQLKKGDVVRVSGISEDLTVSSVGKNYKVYMKGMGGISIYPTQIGRIIKRA